ncbi:hypothetical protein [Actinokineospora pegani]|uniref:hypothetical protein n=1 Tax=Actinokineospora pegani TaxID=2654637 RepID=UPI0012EADC62|nr:hypothetical protein [Actinokineospora pegani]
MNSRTRTPPSPAGADARTRPVAVAGERIAAAEVPTRLWAGLGLAAAAAALQVAGPAAGLLRDQPAPGFAAFPLLVLLAVAPPVAAAAFIAAGRAVVAGGVLLGAALTAPGRALLDLQLAVDPLRASRPELAVPTSLSPLEPATGLWLLVAGHVLLVVAGALAAGRAGAVPGSAFSAEFDDESAERSGRARGRALLVALAAAAVAAVGLLLSPFTSTDAYQLAANVVDSPFPAGAGMLVLAAVTAFACVFGAGSARPAVARGVPLGLALGVAAVTVPQIAAGLTVERLDPAPGPYLGLGAVLLLCLYVFATARADTADSGPDETAVDLSAGRLGVVAGVLGVLTGVACLAAAASAQLVVGEGIEMPETVAERLFVPAGVVVLVLAALVLVPSASATVRPALAVSLAGVPLVAAATLDSAFTATGVSAEITAGAGVWFAIAALLLAAACAVVAGLAGGAERDDVDLTQRTANLGVAGPVAAAALFAIGAFGTPTTRAPELVPAGVWSQFRLTSWGLLLALVVVLAVAALAPWSRPQRAAGLLSGAAAVVAVRALEYPLTSGRAADASPGPGLWVALACLAALLVGAFITGTARGGARR